MRRLIILAIGVLVVAGGVITYLNFDVWFAYPAKRAHITASLSDPDSATYRNERLTRMGWLCGEINARGQSGSHVGYRRFVSGSSNDAYLEGVGYVGDNVSAHSRLIDRLERQAALVKDANVLFRTTGVRLDVSEEKLVSMINSEVFEEKWKAHCAN